MGNYHGHKGFLTLRAVPENDKELTIQAPQVEHYRRASLQTKLWINDPWYVVIKLWMKGSCDHFVIDTDTGLVVASARHSTERGSWKQIEQQMAYRDLT